MITDNIATLFSVLSKMMILIAMGFFAAGIGLMNEQGRKCVTDLVINMVYPCYVLNSFIKNIGMFSGGDMLVALVVACIFAVSMLVVSKFIFPRVPRGKRCVLQYATVVSNSAFLGLPMLENIFGSQGLLCASIFVVPLRVNTFGIAVNFFATKEKESVGKKVKALVTQPSIVATSIGIVIVLIGKHPPEWFTSVLSSVSSCSTPLSMMVIGAVIYSYLKQMRLRPLTLQYTLIRLVIIPAVVYTVLRLAQVDRILLGTAVLMAAMPAGTTGALLADKYGADVGYAGELVLISTLGAILTIPIWCYLCMFV